MSVSKLAATLCGVVLLAAACSASVSPTGTPAGATVAPTTAQTLAPSPTAALPATGGGSLPPASPAGGDLCAAFPTSDPNNAGATFAPDPQLEAHFPASIDGQAMNDVTSGSFAQFDCLGGVADLQKLQSVATYDVLHLTWGTANATVGGDNIQLFAYRLPGGDANQLVKTLAELANASGGDPNIATVGTGTAGGKNVVVAQNTDGTTSYALVSGDTLIVAYDVTQAQADAIFAAVS